MISVKTEHNVDSYMAIAVVFKALGSSTLAKCTPPIVRLNK